MSATPEEKARETIDTLLDQAGWIVQDRDQANIGSRHDPSLQNQRFAVPGITCANAPSLVKSALRQAPRD